MVYLSYIIDFYDNLPPVSAFIHSHKDGYPKAWHTDAEGYSNVVSLKNFVSTQFCKGVMLTCDAIGFRVARMKYNRSGLQTQIEQRSTTIASHGKPCLEILLRVLQSQRLWVLHVARNLLLVETEY